MDQSRRAITMEPIRGTCNMKIGIL